jgi:hypothetical protein
MAVREIPMQSQRSQVALASISDPHAYPDFSTSGKQLAGFDVNSSWDIETQEQLSRGSWVPTMQTTGKDGSTWNFDSKAVPWSSLGLFLAASIVGIDPATGTGLTPTADGTNGYRWQYRLRPGDPNGSQPLAFQFGDDNQGMMVTGCYADSIRQSITRQQFSVSGSGFGGILRHTSDGLYTNNPSKYVQFDSIASGLTVLDDDGITIDPANFCVYLSRKSMADLDKRAQETTTATIAVADGTAGAQNVVLFEEGRKSYRCDLVFCASL